MTAIAETEEEIVMRWLNAEEPRIVHVEDRDYWRTRAEAAEAKLGQARTVLDDAVAEPVPSPGVEREERPRRWKIRRRRADEADDSALSYSGAILQHDEEVEVVESVHGHTEDTEEEDR